MGQYAYQWFDLLRLVTGDFFGLNNWLFLEEFEYDLRNILDENGEMNNGIYGNILLIKSFLSKKGYGNIDIDETDGGRGRSPLVQMLIQFICGYYDLDLRDAAHIGHGRIFIKHGSDVLKQKLLPSILKGSLIAIAVTERQGGSTIQTIKTTAFPDKNGWRLCGEKCWISRINEASFFIVFFKIARSEEISSAIIERERKGMFFQTFNASGLQGWSWGQLTFEDMSLGENDFLGKEGDGLEIFREHFIYYRPMVAMTALGSAASIYDEVIKFISMRMKTGAIEKCRDSALEALGKYYIEIQSNILSSLMAQGLSISCSQVASIWSRLVKAQSVDTAYNIVSKLALLFGATAFQRDTKIAKAQRDLQGFLYADGIHDALLRSAGRSLLQQNYNNP